MSTAKKTEQKLGSYRPGEKPAIISIVEEKDGVRAFTSHENLKDQQSYKPSEKPEIISMIEEKQRKNPEINEMFVRKNNVELITLNEDIKVVGLSFQKCKQTGSVGLNSPMELYQRDKLELQVNIKKIKYPQIGYAVWANADKDMIFGKGVTDLDGQDEIYGSFIIPAGRYMKVSWNAETFGKLVSEAMEKSWERAGAKAFLENNNLIADHTLDIEVYPHETMRVGYENGPDWGPKYKKASMTAPTTQYPEIYSLFSVKEKEQKD